MGESYGYTLEQICWDIVFLPFVVKHDLLMFILEKLFKNQRAMRAVFGLDTMKFIELSARMDALRAFHE